MATRNQDDFIRLTLQWFNDQRAHFGVISVPYNIHADRFSALAEALAAYASSRSEGLASYTVDFS